MLYIKKIEIYNFQKHSKLILNFVQGVNVIWGASRTGKSCIRRAIDWVMNNKKIDAVRKEGTKKTSVKIHFSNNIILEKVRSQSINRYILTVNDETKEFDSIGKEIPQEIKDIINLNPITIDKETLNLNIADQITLPFLLDKPGSFRMKLFNLLTGNDLQDKLLGAFNKSLLNIGRQVKSQDEILVNSKKDLVEKEEEKGKFQKIVNSFKISYEKVKKSKEILDKLIKIKEQLDINEEETEILNDSISTIKTIDIQIINKMIEKVKKLENLISLLESIEMTQEEVKNINNLIKNIKIVDIQKISTLFDRIKQLDTLKSLSGSLQSNENEINGLRGEISTIRLTEVDFTSLQGKIERLNTLNSWFNRHREICIEKHDIEFTLEEIEIEFESQEAEYKKLLKETKKCPTCLNPITEECLKRIKL